MVGREINKYTYIEKKVECGNDYKEIIAMTPLSIYYEIIHPYSQINETATTMSEMTDSNYSSSLQE